MEEGGDSTLSIQRSLKRALKFRTLDRKKVVKVQMSVDGEVKPIKVPEASKRIINQELVPAAIKRIHSWLYSEAMIKRASKVLTVTNSEIASC